MAEIIRMPKMSDTMTEGVIASWLKKVGDEVSSGDILAEVETDKATMELESYDDGVLLYIGVQEKDAVPIDAVIAIIGEKDENIEEVLAQIKSGGNAAKEAVETAVPAEIVATETIDVSGIEATVIRMPKMSDTMTEGVIATWLKAVGDEVSSGDILAEVETDKATMELESYDDGTLLYIGVEAGQGVAIDGIIAIIGAKDADYQTLLKAENQPTTAPVVTETKEEVKAVEVVETSIVSANGGRVFASPLAKKMAEDKGYDLSKIKGSGENGRIIKRDVEGYTPAAVAVIPQASIPVTASAIELSSVVGEVKFREEPVSQMRKVIASRLSESKFTAPHFYVSMEINMDNVMIARKSMNEISPVKISFNDIIVKATAAAIRKHPDVNSSWLGDKIRYNEHINIGIAMAVPDGLLVPVVRFTDNKSISHISAEIKEFGAKAKNKQLQPADWEGNTFTISNLGMFGVEDFTAIINAPDACILAIGGIQQKPVVKDNQVVPGNVMKVTLSSDHRVVDGAIAAAFLQTLKNLLEDPIRLLV